MAVLGIMTHAARRPERYALYAREAVRLGFDAVLLFEPKDVDLRRRLVYGWTFERGGWRRTPRPLPDIAHDMGFYSGASTIRTVRRIKSPRGVPFTGYGLGHKWTIHKMLLQTEYARYLPETELLRTPGEALRFVRQYGAAMVKPRDGKQGKGIVKISRTGDTFRWRERGGPGAAITQEQTAALLGRRFRPKSAIVQRWMDIRCEGESVFDIRALVQKTEGGAWRLTEMAVRQSGVGRIASNVTGGGLVREAGAFVTELYGEAAERILGQCRSIAAGLPAALEARYRKRFVELGIDLAIERGGTVRIIEVNIKPGKKIVRALSGEKAYADAKLAPIRYAKWLSDRRDSLWKGS